MEKEKMYTRKELQEFGKIAVEALEHYGVVTKINNYTTKEELTELYIKAMELGKLQGYIEGLQGGKNYSYGSGSNISRTIVTLESELKILRDKFGIEVD